MVPDDIRKQILIEIRTDAEGVAAKAAVELQKVAAAQAALSNEFAAGTKTAKEFQAAFGPLQSAINFWSKAIREANEELKKANPEYMAFRKAIEDTLIPLEKVQLAAVKAANDIEESAKRKAAADKKAADSAIEAEDRRLEKVESAYHKAQEIADKNEAANAQRVSAQATRDAAEIQRIEALTAKNEAANAQRVAANATKDEANATEAEWIALQNEAANKAKVTAQAERDESEAFKMLASSITATARAGSGMPAMVGKFTASANASRSGAENMSYGLLHISHAFQDLQYGFGAVLNNIPLVVQALGGGPGLAGTIMILGTALNMAKPMFGEFSTMLGITEDKSKSAGDNVKGLEEKIKALTDKGWKIDVDYSNLAEAERKLDEFQKAMASFEAGKKGGKEKWINDIGEEKSKDLGGTDQIAQMIANYNAQKGREHGNESDRVTIVNADREATRLRKSAEGSYMGSLDLRNIEAAHLESLASAARERMKKANEEFATRMAGRFRLGDLSAVGFMRGMANDGFLTAEQGNTVKSMPYTKEMQDELYKQFSPEAMAKNEREYEANRKENQKATSDREKALAKEHAERAKQDSNNVSDLVFRKAKPIEHEFTDKIFDTIAGGGGRNDIEKALGPVIAGRLTKQGANPVVAQEAADKILTTIMEKAFGAILAEGNVTADKAVASIREKAAQIAKEKGDKAGKKHEAADARDAKRGRHDAAASGFANQFGTTPEQSDHLANNFLGMIDKGADPRLAFSRTIENFQQYIQQQNTRDLEWKAAMEQLGGHFGEATIQLQQQRMWNRGFMNRIRRTGGGGRPPMISTFPAG